MGSFGKCSWWCNTHERRFHIPHFFPCSFLPNNDRGPPKLRIFKLKLHASWSLSRETSLEFQALKRKWSRGWVSLSDLSPWIILNYWRTVLGKGKLTSLPFIKHISPLSGVCLNFWRRCCEDLAQVDQHWAQCLWRPIIIITVWSTSDKDTQQQARVWSMLGHITFEFKFLSSICKCESTIFGAVEFC